MTRTAIAYFKRILLGQCLVTLHVLPYCATDYSS